MSPPCAFLSTIRSRVISPPLHQVGGTLSVLPLPVLPFEPEQTLRHYSFHLLYAATQVPLLVVSYQLAIGRSTPSRDPSQPREPALAAPSLGHTAGQPHSNVSRAGSLTVTAAVRGFPTCVATPPDLAEHGAGAGG